MIGHVGEAWARDAEGKAVAPGYTIEGGRLVQTIEPEESTTYPIVEDPTFGHTYGIPTVRLNKAETTRDATDIDGVYLMCGAVALWNAYAGFLCEYNAYMINRGAKTAAAQNACVKILLGPGIVQTQTFTANCQ